VKHERKISKGTHYTEITNESPAVKIEDYADARLFTKTDFKHEFLKKIHQN